MRAFRWAPMQERQREEAAKKKAEAKRLAAEEEAALAAAAKKKASKPAAPKVCAASLCSCALDCASCHVFNFWRGCSPHYCQVSLATTGLCLGSRHKCMALSPAVHGTLPLAILRSPQRS